MLKKERLSTTITLLISAATLVSMLVAYQTGVAGRVGGLERSGLVANVNQETVRVLTSNEVIKHYRAYTDYAIGTTLLNNQQITDSTELAELNVQTDTSLFFFPSQYMNRQGGYNLNQEAGEIQAQASQDMDLDPIYHFQQADAKEAKSIALKTTLILMTVAMLFFSIARSLHPERYRGRLLFTLLGTTAMITVVVLSIYIEINLTV